MCLSDVLFIRIVTNELGFTELFLLFVTSEADFLTE
ncbi:hypothetical protein SAMN05444375_101238 [Segatella baroniae B14]|nr:hypothetical protein SAMN05444375_101238 [Segatella baroniae B14]